MLTLQRVREMSDDALSYTSKDIQEALENVNQFERAGMPFDRKRASEYLDELALIAQVRHERKGKQLCPCCGK
jgi:hypothetical protein